jgi:hypothetical protein
LPIVLPVAKKWEDFWLFLPGIWLMIFWRKDAIITDGTTEINLSITKRQIDKTSSEG